MSIKRTFLVLSAVTFVTATSLTATANPVPSARMTRVAAEKQLGDRIKYHAGIGREIAIHDHGGIQPGKRGAFGRWFAFADYQELQNKVAAARELGPRWGQRGNLIVYEKGAVRTQNHKGFRVATYEDHPGGPLEAPVVELAQKNDFGLPMSKSDDGIVQFERGWALRGSNAQIVLTHVQGALKLRGTPTATRDGNRQVVQYDNGTVILRNVNGYVLATGSAMKPSKSQRKK